jgi:hypothetical protein
VPGAQPGRGLPQRVASSVARGAFCPPGVPGVYRVPRVRVETVAGSDPGLAAAQGWIQQPDYIITLALNGIFEWQSTTPHVDPGTRTDTDLAIDVGEGEDLAAAPSSSSGIDTVIETIYQITYFDDNISGHALRGHNGLNGSGLIGLSFGASSGTYEFPAADDYEFETPSAVFVGDANLSGDVYSTVGAPGSASPAVSGSLWVSPTHYNPFRPVSDIVANDTQLHTWSGASTPWSLDLTAEDLFGATPESGQMRLTVLNSGLTVPGSVDRPTSGPPSGQATASASIQGLTLSATMRPPRHRIL